MSNSILYLFRSASLIILNSEIFIKFVSLRERVKTSFSFTPVCRTKWANPMGVKELSLKIRNLFVGEPSTIV
jgi:hypothetical protein